jgi:DNA-binding transcriptional LysR family regulator
VDRFDIDDPEGRRRENELPELKDAQALAAALELPVPRLRWLAFHREVDSGTHYHRWTVPKRDGGRRLISSPKPDLKRAQRWIARQITEHLPVHGAAHGFLSGRSTVTNAAVHAGARLLPSVACADDLAAGRLVPVLQDHFHSEAGLFIVYPSGRHLSPTVRAFVDHAVAYLDQHWPSKDRP